jgi:hypothetical protein
MMKGADANKSCYFSLLMTIKKESRSSLFCLKSNLVEDPLTTLAHLEPYRLGTGFAPDTMQVAVEAGTIAAKQHNGEGQNTHQQRIDATKNYLSQRKGMKHDSTPYW